MIDSIAAALGTEDSHAAYEMSVAKSEFEKCEDRVLPDGYSTEGYSHDDLAPWTTSGVDTSQIARASIRRRGMLVYGAHRRRHQPISRFPI